MPSYSPHGQTVDLVPPTSSNITASNTKQTKEVQAGASTLTLCLLSRGNDDKDRYAIIPLPESYEAARVAAFKILGSYLPDASPESLALRYLIKNLKEEWVWADISAETWPLIARNGGEFGVVEIPRKIIYEEGFYFHIAKIRYTVGERTGSKTQWTPITDSNIMDRPRNYEQAIQFAKHALIGTYSTSGRFKESDFDFKKIFITFHAIQQILKATGNKPTEVASWLDFPSIAYKNDVAWRTVVPASGAILGIIINSVPGWEHRESTEVLKEEFTLIR